MLLELFGRFKRPRPGPDRDDKEAGDLTSSSASSCTHHLSDIPNLRSNGNVDSFFPNASGIIINQPQFGHSIVNSINAGNGGK